MLATFSKIPDHGYGRPCTGEVRSPRLFCKSLVLFIICLDRWPGSVLAPAAENRRPMSSGKDSMLRGRRQT